MSDITSISKEVIYRLGEHISTHMPELREVVLDWPEPNQELAYPALSISTGAPKFTPLSHGDIYEEDQITDEKGNVWWIVGEYDFRLQLDLWTQSKEQRHVLYERLFNAFNSQFPTMGLSLKLHGYHEVWCRYDMGDYSMEETEDQVQRKEWRVRLSVLAHTEAIMLREEALIRESELHSSIGDNEEDDETIVVMGD